MPGRTKPNEFSDVKKKENTESERKRVNNGNTAIKCRNNE